MGNIWKVLPWRRLNSVSYCISPRRMASKTNCQFKFLLILDLEATCDQPIQPQPQEIIELPCLKLDTEQARIVSTFHSYVRPKFNPNLPSFTTQLTGIVQEMVAKEGDFEEILTKFLEWLKNEGLLREDGSGLLTQNAAFLTCGDWDLKSMMRNQCKTSGVPIPNCFSEWINIKKVYFRSFRKWPRGMMSMLKDLDIEHEGHHHSGIDDVKNIAKITKALVEKGADFSITSRQTR